MSHHAGKPPNEDAFMFLVLVIMFGTLTSIYVFLHNWFGLFMSMVQCGRDC